MTYAYPKICNCLIFKRYSEEYIEITDFLTNEVYYLGVEEVKYAKKLDGKTDPYDIETSLNEEEIYCLIGNLEQCGLLKWNNKMRTDDGTILRTIWEPKWTAFMKLIALLCNNCLLLFWLPILIVGILMFRNNFVLIDYELVWLGTIIGILAGVVFHEFGHAFAGVSYGAKVFEMGILSMFYVLPGAYVIMDNSTVKSRMKRVQILAAGVEMNLLLTGAFLILASIFNGFGGMFFMAAIQNAVIAALNLTLIRSLDGMAIVGELLGAEDIVSVAKNVIFSSKKRKTLRSMGSSGSALVTACYVICVLQLAFPLLMLINVVEVITWFV